MTGACRKKIRCKQSARSSPMVTWFLLLIIFKICGHWAGYMSVRETNDPALHDFPAALQVGLGWSKARGYTRKVCPEWSPVRH